jgi:A/G-specific adenine glycosylase
MQEKRSHAGFAKALLTWYLNNHRSLPWRATQDPYKIWLSEIILQQTRVDQGLPYYEAFIEHFPSIDDLAQASEDAVLRLWQGLGYYNRARNMQATAKYIVEELDGQFPKNYESLLALKGVGPYTAAAIASFAYKEVVPVVDGNVLRVLSRYFASLLDVSKVSTQNTFRYWSRDLMDTQHPDLYNQAIMELGALVCKPKNPHCMLCPLQESCTSRLAGTQSLFPVKKTKVKVQERFLHYFIVKNHRDEFYMVKRGLSGIWRGLYEFYLVELAEKKDPESVFEMFLKNSPFDHVSEHHADFKIVKHLLSHQRLYIQFHLVSLTPESEQTILSEDLWLNSEKIFEVPKPIILQKFLSLNFTKLL